MPGKVKYHSLSEKEKKKYLGEFYDMVSLLSDRREVKNFFKDLLTLSEVVMISRRIQIAKLLLQGSTYDEIREDLKVGSSTIGQVDRWLNNGFGGYKKVIKKHNEKSVNKSKTELIGDENTPLSLQNIKKRYPAHFLLLNILNKNK